MHTSWSVNVLSSVNTEKGIGGYRIYSNPGYYNKEWTQIKFSEQSMFCLGRWLPTDIVSTARLDRVINPIPLYVKNAKGEFRPRKQSYYFLDADYHEKHKLAATNDLVVIKDKKK